MFYNDATLNRLVSEGKFMQKATLHQPAPCGGDVSAANEFNELLSSADSRRRQRAALWRAAIGLQAVDGLEPSAGLRELARRHVEGSITADEVRVALRERYVPSSDGGDAERATEAADKASAGIVKLLSRPPLAFSTAGFLATHRAIFADVYPFAGEIRTCNLEKSEWVLRGDTVRYMDCEDIFRGLEYDLDRERRFSYAGLSCDAVAAHLADFTAGLWQIHAFREGNTRTVAVFLIHRLRSLGFDVKLDVFAGGARYFRDALVRCVYRHGRTRVMPEPKFLRAFFGNLMFGESNVLESEPLVIDASQ